MAMCTSMGLHENGNISVLTKIQTTVKNTIKFPLYRSECLNIFRYFKY